MKICDNAKSLGFDPVVEPQCDKNPAEKEIKITHPGEESAVIVHYLCQDCIGHLIDFLIKEPSVIATIQCMR